MPTAPASTHIPMGTWSIDPARSHVAFRVKQLGAGAVDGAFEEFEGTVDLAGDAVHGTVSVASLDTGNGRRDAHLRSSAFLDAERHPTIAFRSSTIRRVGRGTLEIAGELTIRGVARTVTLTADVEPTSDGVMLTVSGRLNRRDYGVTPNRLLDAVVSDEVELLLAITAGERP